jgi:hypothetical protein
VALPLQSIQPRGTGILVTVVVKNRGSPRIADSWELKVKLVGVNEPYCTIRAAIDQTIDFSDGSAPMKFLPEDAIYRKSETTPIPTGGQLRG